jgi:hypothetical protein
MKKTKDARLTIRLSLELKKDLYKYVSLISERENKKLNVNQVLESYIKLKVKGLKNDTKKS